MAKKTIKAQMKQRRDTKANWAATNPVLLDGELGIVSDDPNLYKVGDGTTAWNDLPFRGFDGTLAQELGTSPNAVISQKAVSDKFHTLEISDNEFFNSLIKEIHIDFGESGKTLADIGKIYYAHKYSDALTLGFYTNGYVRLWGGGSYHYDPGDILDVTTNGIRVRLILNLADKPLQEDTTYTNAKLSDRCVTLESMPILFSYEKIASAEAAANEANTKIAETEKAIAANTEAIENNLDKGPAQQKTYREVSGLTALLDDAFSTEASGSRLFAVRVKEGDRLTLNHKIWLNAEKTSYTWAIVSTDTWNYGATSIIERGELLTGSLVQVNTETINIPKGAKWLFFINRQDYEASVQIQRSISYSVTNTANQIAKRPAANTIVYVGKGQASKGGYETIQEAINDITDATIDNQYELRVCSDETYTDLTKLWNVADPTQHPTSSNPSANCAAVVTKDFINITGYNRRRKISIYAPDSTVNGSLQFIQTLYLQGTVQIDNLDFEIKNGRYAIHQESSGRKTSLDYNARTILSNSKVRHLGNYEGASWTSCYAQANGACSGLEVEYRNVEWTPAFYMHQNANFDLRNSYLFESCRVCPPADGKFMGVEIGMYIGMNGSGQNSKIVFKGSDMFTMYFDIGMMPGNTLNDAARDIRTMIPEWGGYANLPMRMPVHDYTGNCLAFKTDQNGDSVEVLQSGAKAFIYGDDLYKWDGAPNAAGLCIGSEFIGSRGTDYAYTLAHRLGNLADAPKTLVLSVNGSTRTITFAENFVTQDGASYTSSTVPAWSDDQIRQYIQEQIAGKGVSVAYYEGTRVGYPMTDAAEFGRNYNDYAILSGAALVRDTTKFRGWKYCSPGETPEAIAVTRINPNEGGLVALCSKNYFRWIKGLSYTPVYEPGTLAKISTNGNVTTTETSEEAAFICIANNTWKSIQ